ncbi:UDP-N-acetylmuramoyl-tripeptide--D-alanyl-D-alanine ligase [Paenibacillus pinihumi]|uniref:UDP-N-acetylmuramoyl-tripeptide--D-alanyl-D- alanine ligase n=1 Tax=Paenibacillus pinihumi TaxID=669462 RepID=UPI0003F7FDE9|nr:UDP-N-acetylmuramoyl-tripeptide--D-alanyl-D-alanine ligase [Paenibacillus pinihumi]
MIRRTLGQIQSMITGSELCGNAADDTVITGVSINTRTLKPGNLYIPIAGERFNGHSFAELAIEAGAAALLWNRYEPNPPAGRIPVLLVDDTLQAIQALSRAYRLEINPVVIGITGSNGKTSTKDILAASLSAKYRTHKTFGNLNNHLGVPLTLLEMEEGTEIAVIEMGMSGLGEISLLSSLALPDISIITNIGDAHLGDLGSRELIMQAKLEIVEGLRQGGLLIMDGDNEQLRTAAQAKAQAGRFSIRTFGLSDANDYYPQTSATGMNGSSFTYISPDSAGIRQQVKLPLIGQHQILNALAAIAAAEYAGLRPDQLADGLENVQITGMRNEVMQAGSRIIINDAYKSNPASASASLQMLMALEERRQKVAVLGDMQDLGPFAQQLHRQVGACVQKERLDYLFTLGQNSVYTAQEAARIMGSDRVYSAQDKQELGKQLRTILEPDAIILVKGSRAMQLEEVVELLVKHQ